MLYFLLKQVTLAENNVDLKQHYFCIPIISLKNWVKEKQKQNNLELTTTGKQCDSALFYKDYNIEIKNSSKKSYIWLIYCRRECYKTKYHNEKSDGYDISSGEKHRELESNSDVLGADNQALLLI